MSDDIHEIYAIRYGHHDRKSSENFIGSDPHDVLQPLDFFVWAIVGQQFHHYNGAAQVFDDDGGARFVWTTDLLPDELAGNVEAMMDAGIGAIKKTIESG